MNFNFTPSVWANNGAGLANLAAPGGGGTPSGGAPPGLAAYDNFSQAQPRQGGFAALGASFIQRQGGPQQLVPGTPSQNNMGGPLGPAMGYGNMGAAPGVPSYPAPPGSARNQPPPYSYQQALLGGPSVGQPAGAVGGLGGRQAGPAPGGGGAYLSSAYSGAMQQQSQQQQPPMPSSYQSQQSMQQPRPAAGIRYGDPQLPYRGNIVVGSSGLTGAQEPPQRRAAQGSSQVRTCMGIYNGL